MYSGDPVNVEVAPAEMFLGWMLMFGNKVKIIGPETVKARVKEHLESVMEMYEK